MSHILRLVFLVWSLTGRMPTGQSALQHVMAADLASSPRIPVEVILGVAWVESRMDPTATSRVESGRRATGSWPWTHPAGDGPRFCGVMQAMAGREWSRCLAMRDIESGYRAGADEIASWLKISHGNLGAALRGHGCGISGLTGSCMEYDLRVLDQARQFGWRP